MDSDEAPRKGNSWGMFFIMLFLYIMKSFWLDYLFKRLGGENLVKTFFCFSLMVIGNIFQQIYQVLLDLSSTKPEEIIFRKLEFSCQLFTAGSGRMWEWRNVAISGVGGWSFRFLSEKVFSWGFHIISKFELNCKGDIWCNSVTFNNLYPA